MPEYELQQQGYIFDKQDEQKLEIKLTNFEGPLDLLLHLVKENKLEIRDIFVSQVTEQFLQYMSQVADLDIDQACEYMATAATLLEIKSFSLLPKLPTADMDDDPQQVFIRKLEEYKMFKEVMAELKTHETVDRFYREPDQSVGEEVLVPKDNLNLDSFVAAFNKLILNMQAKASTENMQRSIIKETFSVADKVKAVLTILEDTPTFSFFSIFDEGSSKLEMITTFSALLELLRLQLITIKQEKAFDDIIISKRQGIQLNEEEIYGAID